MTVFVSGLVHHAVWQCSRPGRRRVKEHCSFTRMTGSHGLVMTGSHALVMVLGLCHDGVAHINDAGTNSMRSQSSPLCEAVQQNCRQIASALGEDGGGGGWGPT